MSGVNWIVCVIPSSKQMAKSDSLFANSISSEGIEEQEILDKGSSSE
jgi:hypothetical protein